MVVVSKLLTGLGRMSLTSSLRAARAALEKERELLRDDVCVGSRYPGKPSDYRYVMRESCEPKNRLPGGTRTKKPASVGAKTSVSKSAHARGVSTAQTLQEIEQIKHVLEVQYPGYRDKYVTNDHGAVLESMKRMLSVKGRIREPDPEKRYADIIKMFRSKGLSGNPRYRVLTIYLVCLKSSLE